MLNNPNEFQHLKFIANEDGHAALTRAALALAGAKSDFIRIFLEKVAGAFEGRDRISTKKLILQDIDHKYLSFFLSHFYYKDQKASDSFFLNVAKSHSTPAPTISQKLALM